MLKTIKTEEHYDKALARVYELMQSEVKENTVQSDELKVLSILIEEYELKYYPIHSPN
jgi:HTH-type transcriptional regulator/antitoxin HigA